MKHKRRIIVAVALGSLALVLLPLATGAASTVADIVTIMNAGFTANLGIVKLGLCAAGFSALC